jgi:hypothetical protein
MADNPNEDGKTCVSTSSVDNDANEVPTNEGSKEEPEIEVVFETNAEHLFKYDKDNNPVYTSCEAKLNDKDFENYHKKHGVLCDVYQLFDIKEINPTGPITQLTNFILKHGGRVYAERLDFEADSLDGFPFQVVTVWTSKEAFDKWHFVNDHIIRNPKLNRSGGNKHKDVGCIQSHKHLLGRIQSVALEMVDEKDDMYTVSKFEVPYGDKVIPQMKYTVSYRQDYWYEEQDLKFEKTGDPDSDTEIGIVYVFPPKPSSPKNKKAKTDRK